MCVFTVDIAVEVPSKVISMCLFSHKKNLQWGVVSQLFVYSMIVLIQACDSRSGGIARRGSHIVFCNFTDARLILQMGDR